MSVETLPDAAPMPAATPIEPSFRLAGSVHARIPAQPPVREPDGIAPPGDARTSLLSGAIVRTLSRALPTEPPLAVTFDDGTAGLPSAGEPVPGGARVRIHGPSAVARLLPPTETAFADGYLRGDIDIDGDITMAIEAARAIDLRRLGRDDLRRLVRWSLEVRRAAAGDATPRLARPAAHLVGPRHSRARDLEAIRFHYDVGEAFYSLWLDRRLAYSCAYFERADDPARDLDTAQEAKLDLICRKLDLRPGQRLLDIGCGWGSLILHAAERYGVTAVGVTLSQRQADEATRRASALGIGHLVGAEVRDYRDLAELGPFDAVASVGMFEHVGAAMLPAYFGAAFDALVPGGLFLNHGIASTRRASLAKAPIDAWRSVVHRPTFVDRYVFPDGELVPVERAIAVARDEAGFEVLDLQSLRPHYALTLQAWVQRLEARWDEAVEAAGEEVARTWRLYMAGCRTGFEHGELDVAQLLLARPLGDGRPARRALRPWW